MNIFKISLFLQFYILTVLTGVALSVTGCVGMAAPYPSSEIKPDDITYVPINTDIIQQLLIADHITEMGSEILDAPRVKDYRYIIRPADVLVISVPSIVSFNTANSPSVLGSQGEGYSVYDDGTIYLPYSGSILVAGLTLKEAQVRIVRALSDYLKSPQVIVGVQEFRSQRVLITGQVQKPGYLPITDVPITLIGALSTVGGITELRGSADPRSLGNATTQTQILSEYPDLSHIILKRGGTNYTINVRKVIDSGDVSRDLLLLDGDVVVVPAQQRNNVFVLGEVIRPGLWEVNRFNTALADILQATGGINQLSANANRVYVIRGDFKKPTIYQLDASQPDAFLLAQHFNLQPSDVIFVSETKTTRFNRGLQQVLPSIQGLLSTAVIANTINTLGN